MRSRPICSYICVRHTFVLCVRVANYNRTHNDQTSHSARDLAEFFLTVCSTETVFAHGRVGPSVNLRGIHGRPT